MAKEDIETKVITSGGSLGPAPTPGVLRSNRKPGVTTEPRPKLGKKPGKKPKK